MNALRLIWESICMLTGIAFWIVGCAGIIVGLVTMLFQRHRH